MSLRQALNLVWYFLTKEASADGREKLRADLVKPLPGQSAEVSDGVIEAELAMFSKSMAANQKQQASTKRR